MLALILSACLESRLHGILVIRFEDSGILQKKKITFDRQEAAQTIGTPLMVNGISCELRIALPAAPDACVSQGNTGSLVCADGIDADLRWDQSSCHSGYGRSVGGRMPVLFFGYGNYLNAALNQLDKARNMPELNPLPAP